MCGTMFHFSSSVWDDDESWPEILIKTEAHIHPYTHDEIVVS